MSERPPRGGPPRGDESATTDESGPKLLRRTVLKSTVAGAALAGTGARVAAQEDDDDDEVDEAEEEFAEVVFPNQITDGTAVQVESVTLPEGGFVSFIDPVAAHEELWPIQGETMPSLEETMAAQVRGVSEYLEAGTHEDVVIEIEDEPLEGERLYQVFVHRDTTGDEEFTFVDALGEEDQPYPEEFDLDEPVVVDDDDDDEDEDDEDDEDDEEELDEPWPTQEPNIVMGDAWLHRYDEEEIDGDVEENVVVGLEEDDVVDDEVDDEAADDGVDDEVEVNDDDVDDAEDDEE